MMVTIIKVKKKKNIQNVREKNYVKWSELLIEDKKGITEKS